MLRIILQCWFPKEPIKHKAWEMNVGRRDWRPPDAIVLFSESFTPDSYANLRLLAEFGIPVKKLRLQPDTTPTVFGHRPIRQAVLRRNVSLAFFFLFFFYHYWVQKESSSKGSAKAHIAQHPCAVDTCARAFVYICPTHQQVLLSTDPRDMNASKQSTRITICIVRSSARLGLS